MAALRPTAAAHSPARIPTKVDRSAAYAARYLAKNVVAAGLAERCTLQLSYAIGVAKPLSIYVDLHGTGKVSRRPARGRPDGCDGSVAARHPRPISASIVRSTPAPPPMAISAGRRMRMAASRWERTDLADTLKAAFARQPDVRPSGVRSRRRLFRAPEGQTPAGRATTGWSRRFCPPSG